ncbi:hypothetical protein ACHHYP_16511 [Achlya hypogyna]|uniref:C2H2-type domain-containing protein n=1 Tax=Achlya hypogyna TaxID=1202772 RepID=A0A1V9Y6F1_ACHHY|nr:hypothetical protein ACHHYP_16511 [Achlya hypogyna]
MSTALAAARAKTKGKSLLKDVLNAHGDINTPEEKATALSDWNKRKTAAMSAGAWEWRAGASPYLLPQHKVDPAKVAIEVASLVNIGKEMALVLAAGTPSSKTKPPPPPPKTCSWSLLHDGKFYVCSNMLRADSEIKGRRCHWHAPTCRCPSHEGPPAKIPVPNGDAMCLPCFAAAHAGEAKAKQTPVVIGLLRLPGVRITDAQNVQDKTSNLVMAATKADGAVYSATSVCSWQAFQPGQSSIKPYICTNRVLQHPVYLTYMPHCGYHTPTCVYSNTQRRGTCPEIGAFNKHGLCKNHYEALVSTFALPARQADKSYSSVFECPNVVNTALDGDQSAKKHPLAPRGPPPPPPKPPTEPGGNRSLFHRFAPAALRTLWWQINFVRKGPRVAVALQRVFRGNRGRKRVHALKMILYAEKRRAACLFLQTLWRRRQAQRYMVTYKRKLLFAVHFIQRLVRGFLGRRRAKHTRALHRLYWAVGVYLAAHKAVDILRARVDLRRRDLSHDDQLALYLFRRRRAAQILARAMREWKTRRALALLLAQTKFRQFLAAISIQRAWKLFLRRRYLTQRYTAAQTIQARVRGRLTRVLWRGDPGISSTIGFVSQISAFVYRHDVLLPHAGPSYSALTFKLRCDVASRAIQRLYRGFKGRLAANAVWVHMEKRWLWIDSDVQGTSLDTPLGDVGHLTSAVERSGLKHKLPSASYHTDKEYHMRKIYTGPMSPFGHAFKDIDDLYRDMHAERCDTVPPVTCKAPEAPARAPDVALTKAHGIAELKLASHVPTMFHSHKHVGISADMALYPVGTLVHVRMGPRRQMHATSHPGRITKQHQESNCVDIAFLPGLRSLRGIAITEEKHVRIDRLSLQLQAPAVVAPTVTDVANNALTAVRAIDVARPVSGLADTVAPPTNMSLAAAYHEMVVTLRRRHTELFASKREFIDYVFHHDNLLGQYWLRLIHDIATGNNTEPGYVPALHSLDGFIQPLPAVAATLKTKLEQLGYKSEPSANAAPPQPEVASTPARAVPTTTVDDMHTLFHEGDEAASPRIKDDTELAHDQLSLADIHKLVYHLKSIPRVTVLDPIIKVTTRSVRTFVCSHPACGRCFSTNDAARSHQHVHANKVRLVAGDPLVDQYMAMHWPPESPWRDDNHSFMQSKVGYFKCPECDREYSTKRELYRHASEAHGREAAKDRQSQTNRQMIWLGTGERIEDLSIAFPPLFRGLQTPCPACNAKPQRPAVRCRRYPSLSILSKDSDAVIFTTEYPTFAPEVQLSCATCGQFGGPNQEMLLRRYVRIEALVRDTEDWIIGYLYRPPPVAASTQQALVWGYDYRNEVLVDTTHVVCIRATQVVGYAMIYACSRTYFHRFYRGTSGHMEKFCRPLRPESVANASAVKNQIVDTHARAQTRS